MGCSTQRVPCSAPSNAHHWLFKTSLMQASLQCSVLHKARPPLSHPITRADPSTDLGPPCTHPAYHSTLWEQRVPRG